MEDALRLAYHFLKFRSRTVWEMRAYLGKKMSAAKITSQNIEDVISYLLEEGLLDDKKFIGEYVRSRNALKPKSNHILAMELKRLGVSEDDIRWHFEQEPQDEQVLALRALRPKLKSLLRIADARVRFQKAIQFLQRRGFSFDTAKSAVQEALFPQT